jgi:hypothetical protein
MNEVRTTRKIDTPRPRRAPERRAAAVVAQYIHERSTRHGGETRPRQPTLALKPRAWCGADPVTEIAASARLS